jgi:hypothetical protein
MLVSVRARAHKPSMPVIFRRGDSAAMHKLDIDKIKLDSCIQMLHQDELSVLARNDDAQVQIKCTGNNMFNLLFCHVDANGPSCVHCVPVTATGVTTQNEALHPSIQRAAQYAMRQVVPVYSTAREVCQCMQAVFGSVLQQSQIQQCGPNLSGADVTFIRSNSCTVSKLLDIFNTSECCSSFVFSHTFAVRLLMLSATFCATAPSTAAGNLFHASQLQMTDLPHAVAEHLYGKQPEKQHVTILMRGDSAADRIKRFNVAVRIFPRDSEFVREHLPKLTGLNSTVFSDVMVVTGIRNRQAAALFLSSETLTKNSHSLALKAFKF